MSLQHAGPHALTPQEKAQLREAAAGMDRKQEERIKQEFKEVKKELAAATVEARFMHELPPDVQPNAQAAAQGSGYYLVTEEDLAAYKKQMQQATEEIIGRRMVEIERGLETQELRRMKEFSKVSASLMKEKHREVEHLKTMTVTTGVITVYFLFDLARTVLGF